ncbi:unnamed protein product [Protopolystoma xenopodis]|uniref:Uncharacterized protein n=1 Tax=Protopolystoma xenopodis TaxID=117903 RepID=A0A3S5CRY8_9PLAT|nr:unnamed protein product [Protopolystoma xenopodis]
MFWISIFPFFSSGPRLDFHLTPEWPNYGESYCHVEPARSLPVYQLRWSLLQSYQPLTNDRFSAILRLSFRPGLSGRSDGYNGIQSLSTLFSTSIIDRLPGDPSEEAGLSSRSSPYLTVDKTSRQFSTGDV